MVYVNVNNNVADDDEFSITFSLGSQQSEFTKSYAIV